MAFHGRTKNICYRFTVNHCCGLFVQLIRRSIYVWDCSAITYAREDNTPPPSPNKPTGRQTLS